MHKRLLDDSRQPTEMIYQGIRSSLVSLRRSTDYNNYLLRFVLPPRHLKPSICATPFLSTSIMPPPHPLPLLLLLFFFFLLWLLPASIAAPPVIVPLPSLHRTSPEELLHASP
ncbi:hypothetical protein VNO78_31019 [Psophocarpus tetragonolobus]|uniref:Uncharacterized protein n=1 Tax=Psophocarpus tetragonolobus TaxID=3891 RepID=A0AAN9X6B8_PSOTE